VTQEKTLEMEEQEEVKEI